jgi:hypothetical protein
MILLSDEGSGQQSLGVATQLRQFGDGEGESLQRREA